MKIHMYLKGLIMKNGIYLFVILFMGVLGYFVVNDLHQENNYLLSSIIFMIISVIIYSLTTHFKRKRELSSAQKIINVIYISLFAIYGVFTGLSLIYISGDVSMIKYEGLVFLGSSAMLFYGIYVFVRRHNPRVVL